MSFNDGFSSRGVDSISGSDGEILTRVNGQWAAAPNQGAAGTFTGVTLDSIRSNLSGLGTPTSPLKVTDDIEVNIINSLSVTSSFKGDGSQLINLPLSNYATLTGVSASFSTPSQVTAAIENFPTRTEVTGVLTNYATLVGVSSSFARIDISNNFVGNQSVTGFISASAGITGSFSGSDAKITTITASNITASDVITNYVNFKSSTDPTWDNGRVWYNNSTHELNYWTEVNGFNIKLGQQIVQRCKNDQGEPLAKGKIVHISGSESATDTPRIKLADWTNDNLSANTLGLVAENIDTGAEGYVIVQGILKGLNTNSFTPGQVLYLSSSGDYTSTKPIAPKHTVSIGQIVRKQLAEGSIYVSIQNGYELGELHDVSSSNEQDKELLIWDGSVNVWKNSKNLGSYTFTGDQQVTGSVFVNTAVSASQITGALSGSFIGDGSGVVNVAPRDLIAITQITSSGPLVTYAVESNTTTLFPIKFNIDGSDRFAKITFKAPASGKVQIEARFDMILNNSAAIQIIGLHNVNSSTSNPSAGWYRINADNDSLSGQFYATFNLLNLTPGVDYSYYFVSACSNFTGNTIRLSKVQNTTYSGVTAPDLPAPFIIYAYDMGSVSILTNPTS